MLAFHRRLPYISSVVKCQLVSTRRSQDATWSCWQAA